MEVTKLVCCPELHAWGGRGCHERNSSQEKVLLRKARAGFSVWSSVAISQLCEWIWSGQGGLDRDSTRQLLQWPWPKGKQAWGQGKSGASALRNGFVCSIHF